MTTLTAFQNAFNPAKTDKQGLRVQNHALHVDAIKVDRSELALAATAGKGAIKRDASAMLAMQAWADIVDQFKRANCTNVAPMARAVRSIMGQTSDTKALPICPMTREGFYDYPATVALWAVADGKSDKVKETRATVLRKVRFIVDSAQAMYDAAHPTVQIEASESDTDPASDNLAATADETVSLESTAEVTADNAVEEEAQRVNADAEA